MLSLKKDSNARNGLFYFFISVICLDSDVFTPSISCTSKYIFIDKRPENTPSVLNVSYLSSAETEDDVINISTVIDYSRVVFNRWRMRHFTVAVQEDTLLGFVWARHNVAERLTIVLKSKSFHQKSVGGQIKCSDSVS